MQEKKLLRLNGEKFNALIILQANYIDRKKPSILTEE